MSNPVTRPSAFNAWILPALMLVAFVGLLIWTGPSLWQIFTNPEEIRTWISSTGPWAPVIFILLQILQVVVFVLPGEVTQIAGGWIFGFFGGTALSLVGIAIGSSIAFGLTRWLGIRFVHTIAGPETVSKFDGLMASPQFIGSLFLFFLIPGIPKDVLCYVAGLSRLRFFPFLLISSLARLPGILGSSLMGKALFQGDWLLLSTVVGIAALLFGLGWWFREPIFRWIERFAVQKPSQEEVRP